MREISNFQQTTNLDEKSGFFNVIMGAYDGAEVCLNFLEFLYFISSDANTIKTVQYYIEMTA